LQGSVINRCPTGVGVGAGKDDRALSAKLVDGDGAMLACAVILDGAGESSGSGNLFEIDGGPGVDKDGLDSWEVSRVACESAVKNRCSACSPCRKHTQTLP